MNDFIIRYHKTTKDRLKNIKQYGLLKSNSTLWKGMGGVIYLSKNKNDWKGDVLLTIKLDKKHFPETYDMSEWETICWHNIPPENIIRIEEA